MDNINSVAGLKNAIQLLEVKQSAEEQLLKEQLIVVYESLKPINLLRNTLKKVFSTPDLIENISGSAIGAAGGLLLKKLFIGKSGNIFRKLIGSVLQMSATNIVAKNSDLIKSVGHFIIQYLFGRKGMNSKGQEKERITLGL